MFVACVAYVSLSYVNQSNVFFSENFENTDLQHDNVAVLTLPLRYAVDLNVHG